MNSPLTFDLLHRLDSKSAGGRSIASNLMKSDDEVDDDSITAYNEGETGKNPQNFHRNLIALKMHVFLFYFCYFLFFIVIK